VLSTCVLLLSLCVSCDPAPADLQRDAYPVLSNERPTRCTGTALQVAEALMAAAVPPGSCAARIMLFTGGPCTEGSGKIINKDLAEEIRRCVKQRGPVAGVGV
jgi:protein transport protein SEC23